METAISAIEKKNRKSYICFVINEFPETYKIKKTDGFLYLEKYGGLDYVRDNWWSLHIDNQDYAMRKIFDVCKKNGGYL